MMVQGTGLNVYAFDFRTGPSNGGLPMMMDMSAMGTGMMLAAAIYHLSIFVFALLGSAAFIKYLRS